MKLISWNVNGLRAVCGKGFSDIFTALDADFICLQETKMQAGQLDLEFPGYRSFWNYADKKGYSGTAIYTKHEPVSVSYGIGIDEHDHEGRVITLETGDFFLVCVYAQTITPIGSPFAFVRPASPLRYALKSSSQRIL